MADADADLRPADDVVRGLLQPGRRRRVDLVLGRLGGHRARTARPSSARRSTTRACSRSTSTLADIRRERIALPLLRDERPELQVRELRRIVAERAGLARRHDRRARRRARLRRALAAEPPSRADRVRHRRRAAPPDGGPRRMTVTRDRLRLGRRSSCRPSSRSTPTSPAGSSPSSSAGQLEQAGFERAVLGLSGGIDSALVALPRRRGDRRRAAARASCCRTGPRRRRRAPTPRRSSRRSAARASSSTSAPMVDGYFGSETTAGRARAPTVSTPRRCGAATSRPGCGWPCCTTGR